MTWATIIAAVRKCLWPCRPKVREQVNEGGVPNEETDRLIGRWCRRASGSQMGLQTGGRFEQGRLVPAIARYCAIFPNNHSIALAQI